MGTNFLKQMIWLMFFILTVGISKTQINTVKKNNATMQVISDQFFFVENKGQYPDSILFYCNIKGGTIYFLNNGFYVQQIQTLYNPKTDQTIPLDGIIERGHNYKIQFKNSIEKVKIKGEQTLLTQINYIKKDKIINSNTFKELRYNNIYSNVDIKFYINNDALEYDVIVNPKGILNDFILQYFGVKDMKVKNNKIEYTTSLGKIVELFPEVHAIDSNNKTENVKLDIVLADNEIRYSTNYDITKKTLIVDPSLVFVSFSGSPVDNWGFTATYGSDGSFYLGGIVFERGFNVTLGAFQTSYGGNMSGTYLKSNGSTDVVITKFDSKGQNILYATYLGGSSDELPSSLIEDSKGNLIILGKTNSSDFPTINKSVSGGLGGFDIFFTKLNVSGSDVIKSWVIGGSGNDGVNIYETYDNQRESETNKFYSDMTRGEVVLDASDNVYIVSQTHSTNFPTTANAAQNIFGGGNRTDGIKQDGIFIKISADGNQILTSTFIGGGATDATVVLNINSKTNDIYIAGTTLSNNLPGNTSGVLKSYIENIDGFIVQMSNTSYQILRKTYIGTSAADYIYGIQSDKNGDVYVMGVTTGNWPVINATYSTTGKHFVGKIKPDLSQWIYTSRFGTNSLQPNFSPVAFLVDRCQNLYISGFGKLLSNNTNTRLKENYSVAGTTGLYTSDNAQYKTTDGTDFYFTVFERDMKKVLYATFYGVQDNGRSFGDHVDGGTSRFDPNGAIYQAVCGYCGGTGRYPTTPGVAYPNKSIEYCNMLAIKIDFQLAGIKSDLRYSYVSQINKDIVCINDDIYFEDKFSKTQGRADKYEWDFGDGTNIVTTDFSTKHKYANVGTYKVRLVVFSQTACNTTDTSYVIVIVQNNKINSGFTIKRTDCNILQYTFTNTSTVSSGSDPISAHNFKWDFGDGVSLIAAGDQAVSHIYAKEGKYEVSMMSLDYYCNSGDQITQTLNAIFKLQVSFNVANQMCINTNFQLTNTSNGGETYQWFLNDNKTPFATTKDASLSINQLGIYKVKLVVYDQLVCPSKAEYETQFEIIKQPSADFNITYEQASINLVPKFNNNSLNASSYEWDFGDGSPVYPTNDINEIIYHHYETTGLYSVCLKAISSGCSNTMCKPIDLIVNASVIAPNSFTPNGDGYNDVFLFKIVGAKNVKIKIYNRYGQVVFETEDKNRGWDGTSAGQNMMSDTYSYVVDIEDYRGKTQNVRGSIILIR